MFFSLITLKIPVRLLTPYSDNQMLPEEKSYLGIQNHIYAHIILSSGLGRVNMRHHD